MRVLDRLLHPHSPDHGRYGKYYRYELVDPRTGKVFYVGKGTGDRMYQHEKAARALLKSGKMMLLKHKHKVIIEIWDAGLTPIYQVTWRSDNEEEVYQAESARIRELGLEHLTNETYGYRPKTRRTPARR